MLNRLRAAAVVLVLAAPAQAFAWGGMGHRIVGQAAMQALPPEMPGFLRSKQAVEAVGELSREPDRSKSSGKTHDTNRDAAHFIDLDDNARVFGGPLVTELPPTRAEYEKLMQGIGQDSWKAGYLPYAIVDQAQQLAKDFAHWRAETYAIARDKDRRHVAWMKADRARREAQILNTIGYMSHYVGDGAQPLHTTLHYNGWGPFPNPNGYTQEKVHADFEGALVVATTTTDIVRPKMSPPDLCTGDLMACVGTWLAASTAQTIPFYELEKAGGLKPGDPRGPAFAQARLAVGASELRDLILWSWKASDKLAVGWTPVPLADILSGKTPAYPYLYGID